MTRLLPVLLLAGCATLQPGTEPMPDLKVWPTMVDAEIATVTAFAARVPDRCSQLELTRWGAGGMVIYTLPRTIEAFWRVVACERVIELTLDCADSPGAYHCGTHEEWFLEGSADARRRALFFAAALREANQLPGAGACAEQIAVRSLPGHRRTGEVEIERCEKTKQVVITCGGAPLSCSPALGGAEGG